MTVPIGKVPGTLRAVALLRARGVRLGGLVRFSGRAPRVVNGGRMEIGARVLIEGRGVRPVLVSGAEGTLRIGARSYVNWGATITAMNEVEIGEDTRVGPLVQIADTNFHEVAPGDGPRVRPVRIGRNVWLGTGAVVLPGTTIGDHAVIGAASVVRGDVPARTVWAGNPAVEVRRFDAPDDWVRP
jgi:acetyltransferase-like isoleucine patch superfamily enzyme